MVKAYDDWERLVGATLKREQLRQTGRSDSIASSISSEFTPSFRLNSLHYRKLGTSFTYQQISRATGNFSDKNLIKRGGSGDFFRGTFDDSLVFSMRNRIRGRRSMPVVIKRIDLRLVNREAYLLELDLFSKISHVRFVPLMGYCLETENEYFLVYKYMSNRDLSTSLFNKYYKESDGDLPSLDWITRMKIAIGAAEGLTYLHDQCTPSLFHRDLQASSILLDDNFEVRIGSLSQAGAVEMETHTHENRITRTLGEDTSGIPNATCAYDVYCFGKILLELVTGKLGISGCSNSSTEKWLETTLTYISRSDKDLVTNIMDPSFVVDEDLLEEVWVMAIVARTCLDPKPRRRPFMRYILRALENPLEVVREEYISSNRTTSSAEVWTAALFGSWSKSLWSGQS